MRINRNQKVRLSVDCTEEERMYIKILATKSGLTISEYLLSFARKEMPKCSRGHTPNKKTKKALEDSMNEEGEIFDTLHDFWNAMGIKRNAKD